MIVIDTGCTKTLNLSHSFLASLLVTNSSPLPKNPPKLLLQFQKFCRVDRATYAHLLNLTQPAYAEFFISI